MSRAVQWTFVLAALALVLLGLDRVLPDFHWPQRFAWPGVLVLLIAQTAFWYVLAHAWVRIVRDFGGIRLSPWQAFDHQAMVNIGKYFPGKVWGMLARGERLRQLGASPISIAGLTVFEQVLLLHSGALVFAAAALFAYSQALVMFSAILVLLTAPIAAVASGRLMGVASRLAARRSRSIETGVVSITPFRYARGLASFSVVWVLSGLAFIAIHHIFVDAEMNARLVAALLLANALGIWLGFLAFFAPGGIGVREGASVAILVNFMPLESAVLLSLLARIWSILTDLISGGVTLVRMARAERIKSPE